MSDVTTKAVMLNQIHFLFKCFYKQINTGFDEINSLGALPNHDFWDL